MNVDADELLHNLNTQGYCILQSYLPSHLITRLLHSARKLDQGARSGKWPHLRTCPKQFPPWGTTPDNGIWGVQHLLHPDLSKGILTPEEAAVFPELYFHDLVIRIAKVILDIDDATPGEQNTRDDRLMMELFNMLVTPPKPFSLRWHRDDVSFNLSPEEEAAALRLVPVSPSSQEHATAKPLSTSPMPPSNPPHSPSTTTETNSNTLKPPPHKHTHTQYNIPLLPDASLHLIPASHLRPRTPLECALLSTDPHTDSLPTWISVPLQPGDIVFYNNNLIHRGVYSSDIPRYTLHGSVGDVLGGHSRARNVLQHDVREWVGRCDFAGLMRALPAPSSGIASAAMHGESRDKTLRRAEVMRRNLLDLGVRCGDVGFAHAD